MIERCLWTEMAPPPLRVQAELPPESDVAIVGGGYTGLAAAHVLAGNGLSATVLEQHTVGWGASSRNGGFVLPGYQLEIEVLAERYGLEPARRLFAVSLEAVDYLERVIQTYHINCDFIRAGGLTLAAKPQHYRGLEQSQRFLREALGYKTELLSREELSEVIESPRYHGGLFDPGAGSLHPARYLQGLASAAERAGAVLAEAARVLEIRREGAGFAVQTSRGPLRARDIVIATDGYTGSVVPWLGRRVFQVGSYVVATEPLGGDLCQRLLPGGRVMSDTKNLLYYFRLSPDGRLVFGGRASFTPTTLRRSAEILARGISQVFPQLANVALEYVWGGQVGFTRNRLPATGRIDGIYFALGYCGHGVAMATYLGARVGQAIAGSRELPDVNGREFPAIPLYRGRPWFLPLVGAYYRARDWLG
jgi:glycine/D-amino acid oxidase-like deaminating enzyme